MKIRNLIACIFLSKLIFTPSMAHSMTYSDDSLRDGKIRFNSTSEISLMSCYSHQPDYTFSGLSTLSFDPASKSSTASDTIRYKSYRLNLPANRISPYWYNAPDGLVIKGRSSVSYLLNNKAASQLISFVIDSIMVGHIEYIAEISDNAESSINIVSAGTHNDGVFIFSPYLKDGVYARGTTQYPLWRTSQGIIGNKPILDLSVPHAKFMALTLSEDKKDLILTLTLTDELTV